MSFAFPIRVYWEDTDAGGIVFYANYLKFMERARTEWLRSLGIEQQKLRETSGGIFVVSETSLKYHRSARLDDQLLVTAQLRQAGTASLIIEQRVLSNPERMSSPEELPAQALLCEGTIRIGWVNAASMRPSRLPAPVSTVFERIVSRGTPPGAASQQ
ncbi:MAG: tol-pal system-associated acyl-CoA thioesterase [Proteobacteria bacterium]|nr:tol-pal system-associated acyl-CoA thioesterase [Pseudomonadota bacterium]